MEVYFYQAECGDAGRISYLGNDARLHHIFIDSGYQRTFNHVLKDAIKEVEVIDLWVVSHIHDDHIGGIEAYLCAFERKEVNVVVEAWLYNPPRKSLSQLTGNSIISSAKGIRQADLLLQFIVENELQPLKDITSSTVFYDIFGLTMYVITPSVEKLRKTRKKYSNLEVPFEKEEVLQTSQAKSVIGNDYAIKIVDFNLEQWKQDNNSDNGSSITVLTDFNGFKVLWLADAHPNDIIIGLEKLGYTPKNPLICDWVKVPHHGSRGNSNNDLYDRIICSNYLFSVDGQNRHALPNKEVIARILRNKKRNIVQKPYNLYFTYDNASLRNIFEVDGLTVFKDFNFSVFYSKEKYIKVPFELGV